MTAEWRKRVSKLRAIPPASCFRKARGPAEHTRWGPAVGVAARLWNGRPSCLSPAPARKGAAAAVAVLSCRWRRRRPRSCGASSGREGRRCRRPWFASEVPAYEVWESCEFYVNLFLILVGSCFNGKERQVVAVIFYFFLNPQTKKKLAGVTSKLQRSTPLRRNKAPESHCILTLLVYSQLTSLKIAGGLYLNLWYRIE